LLNFIPNIGPIIACLLPLPLIVLSPDLSLTAMITVIVFSSLIQFVSGNVVEPKIMGDSFELHPVAILLTLMIWGMLWGIIGMILATPVTAAMKILFDRFERTRPWPNCSPAASVARRRTGEFPRSGERSYL
jgi:AI-2 transport protein TqsA